MPIFAYPGGRLFRVPNYAKLDIGQTMNLARLADELGYDSLWVADHLMLGHENAIMEGWTTLAALAGSTQRARLGMIHQGHFFRHPAIAAKMTATIDQISGGRFVYFIDGGYGRQEHLAYGLPNPETMEDVESHPVEITNLSISHSPTPPKMAKIINPVTILAVNQKNRCNFGEYHVCSRRLSRKAI